MFLFSFSFAERDRSTPTSGKNDLKLLAMVVAVSHRFGYGLLDVDAMVRYAENWTTVPEQRRCEIVAKMPQRLVMVYLNLLIYLHRSVADDETRAPIDKINVMPAVPFLYRVRIPLLTAMANNTKL